MINFAELFNFAEQPNSNQRKIPIASALEVFYGLSPDGFLRLSFMSKSKAPKLESTKVLRVSQGEESSNVYWTCFDLLQNDANSVYYTFCDSLVSAITDITVEVTALNVLKKRFITWKAMFKQVQSQDASREVIQGLFGELYFLKKYMLESYSVNEAIGAWAGADSKSKDYSIKNDWFEIKTVGANVNQVHISSLSQLSSSVPGHLVVIRVESMSEEFVADDSSINMLLHDILLRIKDELTEEQFLNKIKSVVGNITDKVLNEKFSVKSINFYLVDSNFPRLQESNIPFSEIENIEYYLNIKMLDKYRESN